MDDVYFVFAAVSTPRWPADRVEYSRLIDQFGEIGNIYMKLYFYVIYVLFISF